MNLLLIFVISATLTVSQRLTENENFERNYHCGIPVKNGTLENKGLPTGQDAPWVVGVKVGEAFGTGILISLRHVITTFNVDRMEMEECHNGIITIPETQTREFRVLQLCADKYTCGKHEQFEANKAFYIGSCDRPFGMVLLELSRHFSKDSAICVPEERLVATGEQCDLIELGWIRPNHQSHSVLSEGSVKIKDCENLEVERDAAVCMQGNECGIGVGALTVKNESSRHKDVVAIALELCDTTRTTASVSVAYFLPQICNVSGVCATTPAPATVSTTVPTRDTTTPRITPTSSGSSQAPAGTTTNSNRLRSGSQFGRFVINISFTRRMIPERVEEYPEDPEFPLPPVDLTYPDIYDEPEYKEVKYMSYESSSEFSFDFGLLAAVIIAFKCIN